MRIRSDVLSALIAMFVLALSVPVLADTPPTATQLFEEGREFVKQQKWAEACDRFSKSLALDPAPGTKLNLGECLEKQGLVRKGWLMYEEAARDFDRLGDSRAKFAHERADSAAARLATLVLKVAEPTREGLAIRFADRQAIPAAEIVERVDPGTIQISATAPNKEKFTTTVTAEAGKTVVIDVPVLRDPRPETLEDPSRNVVAPPVAETPSSSGKRRKRVIIAITLGGVGVVALAVSGVLGLSAKSQYDEAFDKNNCVKGPDGPECNSEGKTQISDAGTKADIATAVAIGGGVLVAAGAIVYFTAPKESAIAVSPSATGSSVGVTIGGRF